MSSEALLGLRKPGLLFILSAPAGTGKTTLIHMLQREFPQITPSVSFTSRAPRANEIPGQSYHFISAAEFEAKIAAEEFLEYVQLYGDYYGTSRDWVNEMRHQGKHIFLVIDTQGAQLLQGKIDAIFIFIKPPSLQELRTRLEARKTEPQAKIEERLSWAEKELEASCLYDYIVVNDNLLIAYEILRSIVIAESHRRK